MMQSNNMNLKRKLMLESLTKKYGVTSINKEGQDLVKKLADSTLQYQIKVKEINSCDDSLKRRYRAEAHLLLERTKDISTQLNHLPVGVERNHVQHGS